MRRFCLLMIITIITISSLFPDDYEGKVSQDGSAIVISGNTITLPHTATMTATLSYDVIGSWLEIGFSNTTDIGEYYSSIPSGSEFSGNISLTDGENGDAFDGTAVGPNNLYIFYKVLNRVDVSSIGVSISAGLTDTESGKTIPFSVALDLEGGTLHYDLSSSGMTSQTIYNFESSSDSSYDVGIYKVSISADYESLQDESNRYPVGEYTGSIEIKILGV